MCPSDQAGSIVVHEGADGPLAVRRHDHLFVPLTIGLALLWR
jgi:hypothetical protein